MYIVMFYLCFTTHFVMLAQYAAGGRDLDGSVKVVMFAEGQSKVSTCITLYDDELHEGDEVFSVLLSILNVTALEPGPHLLATVTIVGTYMCVYVCMYICMYISMYVCIYVCI